MLDQKKIIREIYLALVNDENWIKAYQNEPDKTLSEYGITEENRILLKKILQLF